MKYIGCDPGKKGALAVLNDSGEVEIYPFDKEVYRDVLHNMSKFPMEPQRHVKCCLEHVGAMPGQGVTSMFSFGENFGFIQGLLTAYGIPFELVRPQKWKKSFGITADKNTSVEVCKRLFPNAILKRTERCRKDDDGFAEALLLAAYAKRNF